MTPFTPFTSMGALTSKPYAFAYRPWELERAPFLDYFDPLLPSARVDFRGPRIARVLPSGGDWIGDKLRFCHDALSVQRVLAPLFFWKGKMAKPGQFKWSKFVVQFVALVKFLRPISNLYVPVFFGPDLELGFLSLLKLLWARTPRPRRFLFLPPAPGLPSADWRFDFFAPHPLSLDSADLVLLLGANPRVVSPLLNSTLRRLVARGVPVYGFGLSQPQGYGVTFLGPLSQFFTLLEGRHPLTQALLPSSAPVLFLGEELFRLSSATSLVDALRRRLPRAQILPLISTTTSRSMLELGFPVARPQPPLARRLPFPISLGSFHWLFRNRLQPLLPLSLFLGHHYVPFTQTFPLLLLPSTSPFESQGHFPDLFGRSREFHLPLTPPGRSRNPQDLLRALFPISGDQLSFGLSGSLFFRPPFLNTNSLVRPQPPLLSRSDYFGSDSLSRFSPVASLRRRASGRFSNWISRESNFLFHPHA